MPSKIHNVIHEFLIRQYANFLKWSSHEMAPAAPNGNLHKNRFVVRACIFLSPVHTSPYIFRIRASRTHIHIYRRQSSLPGCRNGPFTTRDCQPLSTCRHYLNTPHCFMGFVTACSCALHDLDWRERSFKPILFSNRCLPLWTWKIYGFKMERKYFFPLSDVALRNCAAFIKFRIFLH